MTFFNEEMSIKNYLQIVFKAHFEDIDLFTTTFYNAISMITMLF